MMLPATTTAGAHTGKLRAHELGIATPEYALMVAVVVLLLAVGFFLLSQSASTRFSRTGTCIAQLGCGSSDSPGNGAVTGTTNGGGPITSTSSSSTSTTSQTCPGRSRRSRNCRRQG